MDTQNCLEILRTVKDVAFATVDEAGLAQVRFIDVMHIDEGKLYFCTARGKDFYGQLMHSGSVAITGMNQDYQMVRLSGTARRLTEQKEWIDRIFAENPSMQGVYPGESRYILEAFCIDRGELEFFDLGKRPVVRQSFSLGQAPVKPKGFRITGGCIGCGKCSKRCPQQCIQAGTPYVIRQEHCLHCGLCYETCPVHATVKRGVRQ